MSIGTSLGAFHEDEFAHVASPWMENPEMTPDKNTISPNEIMPQDDTLDSNSPLVIPIMNLTNTPDEVFSALEGGRGTRFGYSTRGGPTTQMRRGANDNKDLEIHDPIMEKGIEYAWDRMVRGQQIVADRQTLINKQSESPLNDIEKARLNRLDKEHSKHFGNYYPD